MRTTGTLKAIAGIVLSLGAMAFGQSKTQPVNGGTGQNSSAWTGCPLVTSGVWSNVPCGYGVGDSDVFSQTSSQTTVNVVSSAPATGKYRISYYANEHTLCATGYVSVLFTFSWSDPVSNRSINSLTLTIGVTQSAQSGSIQGSVPIYAQASTAISYTSTVTGSCTTGGPASYDIHVAVESVP